MGSDYNEDNEQPAHTQQVTKSFWIDKYEVTQSDFRLFGGIQAESSYFKGDDRPIDNITWFEARDFCLLRNARLPTELEWEYAARGPKAYIYPWWNEWDRNNVISNRSLSMGTANVGSILSGRSWVGALDMSGNVWEWVSSLYLDYPYEENHENNENIIETRILRGGSWYNDYPTFFRTAFRDWDKPNFRYIDIGFRCARDFSESDLQGN